MFNLWSILFMSGCISSIMSMNVILSNCAVFRSTSQILSVSYSWLLTAELERLNRVVSFPRLLLCWTANVAVRKWVALSLDGSEKMCQERKERKGNGLSYIDRLSWKEWVIKSGWTTEWRKWKGSWGAVSCHLSCCDFSRLTAHKSPSISQLCDMPPPFYF